MASLPVRPEQALAIETVPFCSLRTRLDAAAQQDRLRGQRPSHPSVTLLGWRRSSGDVQNDPGTGAKVHLGLKQLITLVDPSWSPSASAATATGFNIRSDQVRTRLCAAWDHQDLRQSNPTRQAPPPLVTCRPSACSRSGAERPDDARLRSLGKEPQAVGINVEATQELTLRFPRAISRTGSGKRWRVLHLRAITHRFRVRWPGTAGVRLIDGRLSPLGTGRRVVAGTNRATLGPARRSARLACTQALMQKQPEQAGMT